MVYLFVWIILLFSVSCEGDYYYSKNGVDGQNNCESSNKPCLTLEHVISGIQSSKIESDVVVNCLDDTKTRINNTISFSRPALSSFLFQGESFSSIEFSGNGRLEIEAKKVAISNFLISSEAMKIETPLIRIGEGTMENVQVVNLNVKKSTNLSKSSGTVFVFQVGEVKKSSFSQNVGDGVILLNTQTMSDVNLEENVGFLTLVVGGDSASTSPSFENVVVERNKYVVSVFDIKSSEGVTFSGIYISNNTVLNTGTSSIINVYSDLNIIVEKTNITGSSGKEKCISMTSPKLKVEHSIFTKCICIIDEITDTAEFTYFNLQTSSEPITFDKRSLVVSFHKSVVRLNTPNGGMRLTSFLNFVSEDCIYYGNRIEKKYGSGGGLSITLDPYYEQLVQFKGTNSIDNNRGDHGGGLYIEGTPNNGTKISLPDTTSIVHNVGEYGGGAFFNFSIPDDPNPEFIINSALINHNTGNVMAGGLFLNQFTPPPFPMKQLVGQVFLNEAPVFQDVGGPPCKFSFFGKKGKTTGKMVCNPYQTENEWLCNLLDCIHLEDVFGNDVIVWRYFDIVFEHRGHSFKSFTHLFNGTCFLFTYLLDNLIYHEGQLGLLVEDSIREAVDVEVVYEGNGKKKHDHDKDNENYWSRNYQYYLDGGGVVLLCCFLLLCCVCCVTTGFGCLKMFQEIDLYRRRMNTQKLKEETHFSMSINSDDDNERLEGKNELDPLLPSIDEIEDEERKEVVSMFSETCDMIFSLGNKEKLGRVQLNLTKIREKASVLLGSSEVKKQEVTPIEIFELLVDQESIERADFVRILFTFPGHENVILDELESEEDSDGKRTSTTSKTQEEEDHHHHRGGKKKLKKRNLMFLKLDQHNNRVLHYACFFENEEYIQILLDHGVNVKLKNSYGRRGRYAFHYLSENNAMYKKVHFRR